jgi:hypothetical protein
MPHKDPIERAAYNRAYHQKNHEAVLAQRATRADAIKDHGKLSHDWFSANLKILKATQGCSACGRKDGKLYHHHVDKTTKKLSVGQMHRSSMEAFVDEIAKCIVMCARCHLREHARLRKIAKDGAV